MKKLTTLGLLLASSTLVACSMQDAGTYNDNLVDAISMADDAYIAFETYAEETEIRFVEKIEEKRQEAIKAQDEQIAVVEELGSFKDEDTFQQQVLTYIKINKEILEEEYKELLTIRTQIRENEEAWTEISAEIMDKQNTILESINDKLSAQEDHFDKILETQEEFAEKHNYELEE